MWSKHQIYTTSSVTLHVSVWVEIENSFVKSAATYVTLHVSVWVEILKIFTHVENTISHAPRERVSWNVTLDVLKLERSSHAPRERVSWNL